MKTRRMVAALAVALLSVTAVMAKDIRTAVFKVSPVSYTHLTLPTNSRV